VNQKSTQTRYIGRQIKKGLNIKYTYSKMSAAQTLKGLLSEGVMNTSDATLKSNSRIEIKEAD